jgi:hypothetical protein
MTLGELRQLRQGDRVRWQCRGEPPVDGRVHEANATLICVRWLDGEFSTRYWGGESVSEFAARLTKLEG